jgi:hypothetical protein
MFYVSTCLRTFAKQLREQKTAVNCHSFIIKITQNENIRKSSS